MTHPALEKLALFSAITEMVEASKTAEQVKDAVIRHIKDKGYCVLSEKGKNLGCSPTKAGAKKRLGQVEYFKHRDQKKVAFEKEAIVGFLKGVGHLFGAAGRAATLKPGKAGKHLLRSAKNIALTPSGIMGASGVLAAATAKTPSSQRLVPSMLRRQPMGITASADRLLELTKEAAALSKIPSGNWLSKALSTTKKKPTTLGEASDKAGLVSMGTPAGGGAHVQRPGV